MLERVFREPKFRVRCLGGLKLVEASSGTDMTPASRKTRALIGYLCIVGKPVGRERLASLLWGDRGDEQARASLRQAIYELRSILGGDHLLRVERDTVAVGDDVVTDVSAILAAAKSGDLQKLSGVLSEWRGDFFEDLPSIDPSFDAWLQAERVRVQESLIDAAADAARAGMTRGEVDPARKIVNLIQQRDGSNEVAVRLGLQLDRLAEDSAALHRRFERFRELLKSELNAAPSAETQRLFHELTAPSALATADASKAKVEDALEHLQPSGEPGIVSSVEPSPAQLSAAADSPAHVARPPIRTAYWIGLAAIVVAVACLGALTWFIWSPSRNAKPSRQEPLLAVLPFQSLSGDAGARSVSGGINDEIGAGLRKMQIRVAPTPSSFGITNAGAPKALSATHVLSGSVERVAGRIHVIAQLMDIGDDRIVWSRAFDRPAALPSVLRQDVATQIAGAVGKLLLSGSFGAQHVSAAAYDNYLKGRALFRQRDPRAAIAELEASVRLAPDFAKAWSTLAAARWLLATSGLMEHKEAYNSSMAAAARTAAQRALALNPNDGEALGVLALLLPPARLQDIDRQLERALRSEPHNTQLLAWHGDFLMFVGRTREALDELTRAYELDHGTPSVTPNLVLASLKTGRFDEATEIIALDRGRDSGLQNEFLQLRIKSFLYRHDWFGLANYLNALPNKRLPRMAVFLRLCRETAIALGTRETGNFGSLRASWRTAASANPDDAVQFLSALGDANGALDALQAAVSSRQNHELFTDPEWEALFVPDLIPLRRDPRVPKLLASWGLFDYWRAANRWPDFMQ